MKMRMTRNEAKRLCEVEKWPWPLPQDTTKGEAEYYTLTSSDDPRIAELETALSSTLPMAKGYAAQHRVGRNAEKINVAEALLERLANESSNN